MKVKKEVTVEWNGKSVTLRPGVDYKNLPAEVTEQLPKARKKNVKAEDAS